MEWGRKVKSGCSGQTGNIKHKRWWHSQPRGQAWEHQTPFHLKFYTVSHKSSYSLFSHSRSLPAPNHAILIFPNYGSIFPTDSPSLEDFQPLDLEFLKINKGNLN